MTSNPHPEHGPLWTTRRDDGTVTVWTEDVDGDGYAIMTREGDKANAIEAQLTPLPDGVCRSGSAFVLTSSYRCPDGWCHPDGTTDRRPYNVLVRRIPAEPPAPPTDDVPLHELCGRKLPGCDWVVRAFGLYADQYEAYFFSDQTGRSRMFPLNADGTVTVQAQGVES